MKRVISKDTVKTTCTIESGEGQQFPIEETLLTKGKGYEVKVTWSDSYGIYDDKGGYSIYSKDLFTVAESAKDSMDLNIKEGFHSLDSISETIDSLQGRLTSIEQALKLELPFYPDSILRDELKRISSLLTELYSTQFCSREYYTLITSKKYNGGWDK